MADLISCVMTTYRRKTCVQRAFDMFAAQDYPDRELIIFNTDVDHPIRLASALSNVHVYNCDADFQTGQPYTNTGAIRRDAFTYATGKYYVTWDDDDLYFPWDLRQRHDGVTRTGKPAWKPYYSFMKQYMHPPTLAFNYMEASVLVERRVVEEAGFNAASGPEHISWFNKLWNVGELIADHDSVPGYCFNWSDPPEIGGHKQSNMAEFVRLDNFARHKLMTTDRWCGEELQVRPLSTHRELLAHFKDQLLAYQQTKPELFARYIEPHVSIF